MHNVEESATWDAIRKRASRIAKRRRKRRVDILVALALLLLLIFGWVKDVVRVELWPGGNLLTASPWNHAWFGGTLR
jgi:hypothetical protein